MSVLKQDPKFFSGIRIGEVFEVRGLGVQDSLLVRLSNNTTYEIHNVVASGTTQEQGDQADAFMIILADLLSLIGLGLEDLGYFDDRNEALVEKEISQWAYAQARKRNPVKKYRIFQLPPERILD